MSSRTRAEVILVAITFIWGSTFVVTKSLLEAISPFLYITLRFTLAAIVFGALFRARIRALSRRGTYQGLTLGFLLFCGFSLQTIGLQYTTASKSAFFTGMLVVFTALGQTLVARRLPGTNTLLGVVLVSAGLYFLTSPEGSSFNLGDLLTVGCAVLFGVYIVLLDTFGKETDFVQLTFTQFIACSFGGLVAITTFELPSISVSIPLFLEIVYLALFATVIAISVQTRYQRDTTPTRSAVIFSLEPVIAAGFAYVSLGERLGWVGVFGGCLILTGVIVSEMADLKFARAQ